MPALLTSASKRPCWARICPGGVPSGLVGHVCAQASAPRATISRPSPPLSITIDIRHDHSGTLAGQLVRDRVPQARIDARPLPKTLPSTNPILFSLFSFVSYSSPGFGHKPGAVRACSPNPPVSADKCARGGPLRCQSRVCALLTFEGGAPRLAASRIAPDHVPVTVDLYGEGIRNARFSKTRAQNRALSPGLGQRHQYARHPATLIGHKRREVYVFPGILNRRADGLSGQCFIR